MSTQLTFDDQDELVRAARRFTELHQLLYMRGGVKPVNAAIDELTKLLFLNLAAERCDQVADGVRSLLAADATHAVQLAKSLFVETNRREEFRAQLSSGERQSIWPEDEPLRLNRGDVLTEALGALHEIDLGSTQGGFDPLGTAFDVFLQGRYDHSGGLGTYLTPGAVTDIMAKVGFDLLDSSSSGSGLAGDPCCGTGRFLTAMIEEAKRRDISRSQMPRVVGFDQSASAVAMSRVNLMAYGFADSTVARVDDSVVSPDVNEFEGAFSLILTNPPFGANKYDNRSGIGLASRWLPSLGGKEKTDPALVLLARCMDLLAEGGVLGIILPDGLVDGRAVRDLLLDGGGTRDASAEVVLSLPKSTFEVAGTVAKTSVLFVRRGASDQPYVGFSRAAHVGHMKQGNEVVADPNGNDLPQIYSALTEGRAGTLTGHIQTTSAEPLVAFVSRDDLQSLDVGRFDPDALEARERVENRGGVQFAEYARPVQASRQNGPQGETPFISVLHIDELGVVDWLEADEYRPTTPGLSVRGGQILISLLNPSKLRATVIPEGVEHAYCSAEFGVFETDLDPWGVLSLIHSNDSRLQLRPLGRGTSSSRRRISEHDVLNVMVDQLNEVELKEVGSQVEKQVTTIADARRRLSGIYD